MSATPITADQERARREVRAIDYTAMSRMAMKARYGSEDGDPTWFCGRCGHNSTSHLTRCRKCDCPGWVHHICDKCGEWRAPFDCTNCRVLRVMAEMKLCDEMRSVDAELRAIQAARRNLNKSIRAYVWRTGNGRPRS